MSNPSTWNSLRVSLSVLIEIKSKQKKNKKNIALEWDVSCVSWAFAAATLLLALVCVPVGGPVFLLFRPSEIACWVIPPPPAGRHYKIIRSLRGFCSALNSLLVYRSSRPHKAFRKKNDRKRNAGCWNPQWMFFFNWLHVCWKPADNKRLSWSSKFNTPLRSVSINMIINDHIAWTLTLAWISFFFLLFFKYKYLQGCCTCRCTRMVGAPSCKGYPVWP